MRQKTQQVGSFGGCVAKEVFLFSLVVLAGCDCPHSSQLVNDAVAYSLLNIDAALKVAGCGWHEDDLD
jgi:hypothetical protein